MVAWKQYLKSFASFFELSLAPSEYLADNPQFPTKLIVFILFIGAFFGYLNDKLLNVALPTLMNEFQVSKTTVQWLVTGFLLLMGALTPITASLIQWFPTRRLILITQGLFVVGSLICALAPNFAFLLLGRMVQAVSAALFVPLLMNGILTIYPPHKRGTAMGLVTMMFTVAPALGPTLSGMIIDELNWRYLFGLTIPFMLGANDNSKKEAKDLRYCFHATIPNLCHVPKHAYK